MKQKEKISEIGKAILNLINDSMTFNQYAKYSADEIAEDVYEHLLAPRGW